MGMSDKQFVTYARELQAQLEEIEVILKISVFGLGFVGLTTGLGFAQKGFTVHGFDVNVERSNVISGGNIPFHEPGLDDALINNLNKTFIITKTAQEAAKDCDVCFLCVGTPGLDDGSADLSYVFSVIDDVIDIVSDKCVFVVKSTVPPGSSSRVADYLAKKGASNPVAMNPEFLREGYCWEDFMEPDRVVCGVDCDEAKKVLAEVYAPFNAPVRFVTPSTAEFIKYLSNSLLATLISYANEMSLLADAVGDIEIAKAFKILHEDKRLAGAGINSYIYPGCGYGGYCLPKDTMALAALGRSKGRKMEILENVISLNDDMPKLTAQKIIGNTNSKNDKIGILGLSFKAGSDDIRDSSAAKIIKELFEEGFESIFAFDPMATEEFQKAYNLDIVYCESAEDLCDTADTIALVTAWKDFEGINKKFPNKKFIDCRYFWSE